jgi:hypothetical protein
MAKQQLPWHVTGMISGFSMGVFGLILIGISYAIGVTLSVAGFVSLCLLTMGGFMTAAAIPFGLLFLMFNRIKCLRDLVESLEGDDPDV